MVLPIVAYGSPILRQQAQNIEADYPDVQQLIADMWETMYYTNGVGLAAPQVNRAIRLFVVDRGLIFNNIDPEDEGKYPDAPGIKRVFINARVEELEGDDWTYNEGCLSIPKVREDVNRPETVTLSYVDEQFQPHTETFTGLSARVILHEYDHIEGKLFIDYLSPLKRRLLKGRLDDISKGKIKIDYRMIHPK